MPDPVTGLTFAPTKARRRARGTAWQQSFLDAGPIDVTVCIANWNCRTMLRACLASLHDAPQGVRLETVVVDNGSTDGAADMVAREYPEVILVRNSENRGFARANNQAAALAKGRYLFFLNNDTVVPRHTLHRLVRYLEAHPEVGMVGPRLRDGAGRIQVSYRTLPTVAALLHRTYLFRWTRLFRAAYRQYRRHQFDPTRTRPVEVLMGAAVLLPRDAFFEAGGWDEDYTFGGEDIELSARVGQRRPLVYHPEVTITHFGRVSTRLNVRYSSPNVAIGFARYLRKNGASRPALWLYKLAVTLDAPIEWLAKAGQGIYRRWRGQDARADKSMLAAAGYWHFLRRGLPAFWRV